VGSNKKARFLREVLPHEELKLRDGKKVKNLYELAYNLRTMPNEVFGYHVSFKRNDFSDWVAKVIGDKILAKKVKNAKDKEEMSELISERVQEIEKEVVAKEKANNAKSKKNKKKITAVKANKLNKKSKSGSKNKSKDNKKKNKLKSKNKDNKKGYEDKLNFLLTREKFIIEKEREIEFRERKILEIEEKIENKLKEMSEINRKRYRKEFLNGMIVGILLVILGILGALIYWKLGI